MSGPSLRDFNTSIIANTIDEEIKEFRWSVTFSSGVDSVGLVDSLSYLILNLNSTFFISLSLYQTMINKSFTNGKLSLRRYL